MTRRSRNWLPLLLLAALLAGCTARPAEPAEEPPAKTPPAKASPAVAPKVAWEPLFDSGSADLFYAAPDGSGYLFLEDGGALLLFSTADKSVKPIKTTVRSFQVGDATVEVQLAETPYGRMLVTEEQRPQASLSPDGRKLAIARNGRLVVADLESGTLSQVSSEPQPPPVQLVKHQRWDWALFPSWSADGRWIEFYATREQPNLLALWRVPAAGGQEELVSRERRGPFGTATLPDGRVALRDNAEAILVYPAGGGEPVKLGAGLTGPYELSPDGCWGLILDRKQPALHLVDVAAGTTRVVPLPVGSGPTMDVRWHGDQAAFLNRPVGYDGPSFLSVLDMPSGKLTHYTAPDPTRGGLWPLGWDAQGRLLVRVLPLSDWYYPDQQEARSAPQGVWRLDPTVWQPPKPAIPTLIRYARIVGPNAWWKQDVSQPRVNGGVASAEPDSFLLLRFDQPLDEAWIRQAVRVEGPGTVEVHGALLGLAAVRFSEAKPGETVRVQVPDFAFDLRIDICAPGKRC